MFLPRLKARLLAAGVVALVGTATASAQWVSPSVGSGYSSPGIPSLFGGCGATNQGTYGPSLFAPNKDMSHRPNGGSQPLCANNNYPLSDWNYIRKYCGPTFVPGSCYGHFQTKWRKWEDICPGGTPDAGCPVNGGGVTSAPVYAPSPLPPQVSVPVAPTGPALIPVPASSTPLSVPAPLPATPVEPVAPPKVPAIPKLSVAAPAEEKTVTAITAEQGTANPDAPQVVRPLPETPRLVVPPLPDNPQK